MLFRSTTAPVISTLPGPTTIQCPASPSFTTPTATDACDPSPKLTFADVTTPGTCAQKYSVTRTWTAKDACGNTSTASQTINVRDDTAPTLSVAGRHGTINCPATPAFTPPTATDACDPSPVVSLVNDVTTPGTCPGSYSETRTWKATDACGNMSGTVSQTINVQDVTPPSLSAAGPASTLQSPNPPPFPPPTATTHAHPHP